MKFYKVIRILSSAVLLLSCDVQDAELFRDINTTDYIMFYYTFDGETAREAVIAYGEHSVDDMEAEILAKLCEVDAKAVRKTDAIAVTAPAYGLEFLSFEEEWRGFGWSDGYLYTADGAVYEFDFDFPAMLAGYPLDWEGKSDAVNDLPCAYYMTQKDGGWEAEFLRSGDGFVPVEDLTEELVECTEEEIVIEFEKHGLNSWSAQPDYKIQVKLDGSWYEIPRLPGYWNVKGGDTAMLLGGLRETRVYSLVPYGELPAGEYRIIVSEDAVCEFFAEGGGKR